LSWSWPWPPLYIITIIDFGIMVHVVCFIAVYRFVSREVLLRRPPLLVVCYLPCNLVTVSLLSSQFFLFSDFFTLNAITAAVDAITTST
jgi:hypothetical protein